MNTTTQTAAAAPAKPVTSKPAKAPKAKPATGDKAPATQARDWAAAWVHDGWQADAAGPRVTRDQLTVAGALIHAMGGRTGVETLHIAMCLRPQGCTVKQFTNTQAWANPVDAGPVGPANNKRNKLSTRATGGKLGLGWCEVTELSGTGATRGVAFHLRLSAKGVAVLKAAGLPVELIDRFTKAPGTDKPAKATAKAKGASKAAAGTTTAAPKAPISEPAKPVAPVPTGQPTAPAAAPKA